MGNIITKRPVFPVSIGAAYFCLIKNKTETTIEYEKEVIEVPTIKTLELTRNISELTVWASGQIYDHLSRTIGGDINLNAVILPPDLLRVIEGNSGENGSIIGRINDVEREFAFGYWGENSDGSMIYVWHPVSKLIPTAETYQTRTENMDDPQRNYSVKVIPFDSYWIYKYYTQKRIEAGYVPLTINEFFSQPIFKDEQLPAHTPLS